MGRWGVREEAENECIIPHKMDYLIVCLFSSCDLLDVSDF